MNTKPYRPYSGKKGWPIWLKLICILLVLAIVCYLALEAVVLFNAHSDVDGQPGAMVILGAQLKSDGPSLFLQRRLEAALAYLEDHPDVLVVVSGGQGSNEPDTEANGMERFLRAGGFAGTILKEDRSHNTFQNLTNSKRTLEEAGYDLTGGVVVVSNDFHLARAKLLAERVGFSNVSTLAAPSDHLLHKVYNYLREPVGLVKSFVLDR